MLAGDHVTDDAGTGFVHTAPGHGADDFAVWTRNAAALSALGVDVSVPFVLADDGRFTDEAVGFGPSSPEGAARVLDDHGRPGDANARVTEALAAAGALLAKGKHRHLYPHSWRSRKPVVVRNTPQWFVHMDKRLDDGRTLRVRALDAVAATRFEPAGGKARLRSMVETRPDWVLSRQRKWGVPLTLFHDADGNLLRDPEADRKVLEAFRSEGADAWFAQGAKERFLGHRGDRDRWTMVMDVLDVWFDSGCSHAFALRDRADGHWPADVYLEGSDQHRGWFQASLLESCATRGKAPFRTVVTHGFVMADGGAKMSKSLGNAVSPLDVVETYGADVLRLWVMTSDYRDDLRVGESVLKAAAETYRKLRNGLRWMVGMLPHRSGGDMEAAAMPELERYVLHRLSETDEGVRSGYDAFEFAKVVRVVGEFLNGDLSALYFTSRKDALYCDAPSSLRRRASLQVLETAFRHVVKWLAPMLPYTSEELWLAAYPDEMSVHLEQFEVPAPEWRNDELAARWRDLLRVRSVVLGALETERIAKRMGSSLDAAPSVLFADPAMAATLAGMPLAEVCVTSGIEVVAGQAPANAFGLGSVLGVGVLPKRATGRRCARSWRVTDDVGADAAYPEVSLRDALALRELGEQRD
jgi:isoleucyl-tRNA synthetase